jgi:hypothetical protein
MARFNIRIKGTNKPGVGNIEFNLIIEAPSESEAKSRALTDSKIEKPGYEDYSIVSIRELN